MRPIRLALAAAALTLSAGATLAEDLTLSVPLFTSTAETYSTGFGLTHLLAGVFTVNGLAGFGLPDDSALTASYSGTVNIATAVSEPGTLVLLLAGLGAVGFMVRRRLG